MSTIEAAFTAKLPYPVLTHLPTHYVPTALAIHTLKHQVMANSVAMGLTARGGLGMAGYMLTVAEYAALQTAQLINPLGPFVKSVAPTAPILGAQTFGGSEPAIAVYKEIYDLTKASKFNSYKTILAAQLVAAIPNLYIASLPNPMVGFAGTNPRLILNHLITVYEDLTPYNLKTNDDNLKLPWNPDTPIKTPFNEAHKGIAISTNGQDPMTIPYVVRAMLIKFEASGVLALDCRDWRKSAVQNLDAMQTHFIAADKDRRKENQEADILFVQANAAGQQPPNTARQPLLQAIINGTVVQMSNCWTHGLGTNANHTTATCNRTAPGHQATATADNMMGVNNSIIRLSGQPQIYRSRCNNNNSGGGNGGGNGNGGSSRE